MCTTEGVLVNNLQTYRKALEEMDAFAGGKKSVVNTDCQRESNFAASVKNFIITNKQTCAFSIKIHYLSFCAVHGVIDWNVSPPSPINILKL